MKPTSPFENAIRVLLSDGVNVQKRPYGFSLIWKEGASELQAQCGLEHSISDDDKISLAINLSTSGVEWFFRSIPLEMANLLIFAHKLFQTGAEVEWIKALKLADAQSN